MRIPENGRGNKLVRNNALLRALGWGGGSSELGLDTSKPAPTSTAIPEKAQGERPPSADPPTRHKKVLDFSDDQGQGTTAVAEEYSSTGYEDEPNEEEDDGVIIDRKVGREFEDDARRHDRHSQQQSEPHSAVSGSERRSASSVNHYRSSRRREKRPTSSTQRLRASDAAKQWYKAYNEIKAEREADSRAFNELKAEREADNRAFNELFNRNAKTNAKNKVLLKALDYEREQTEKHLNDKNQLEIMYNRLEAAHIKAITSVGTGLHPISDLTFSEKFQAIHVEVGNWCRRVLMKGDLRSLDDIAPATQRLLKSRLMGDPGADIIQFTLLIEAITWGFLEAQVFAAWLPGMWDQDTSSKAHKFLFELESAVRLGDTTKSHERAKYWRAYTASLLFQNPDTLIAREDKAGKQLEQLMSHLSAIQHKPKYHERYHQEVVQKSLHAISTLAAELRCQRGSEFEMDKTVKLSDKYDDEKMEDMMYTEEEPGKVRVVGCIISRGWRKRVEDEEDDEEEGEEDECGDEGGDEGGEEGTWVQICKTRVVVFLMPVEVKTIV